MSSGMNLKEAKEYAETMSYRKAINNIRYAKGIAYKKATWIKLRELAEIADTLVRCSECKYWRTRDDGTNCCAREYATDHWQADDFCSYGERKESE